MRERMSFVGSAALSAVAAALLLVAIVLNAGQRNVRLLARCSSLASSCKSNDLAALDDDAPLTFAADGSISADTARQWRKKAETAGQFPMPDNSFFDATNSDVWNDKQGASTAEKETSWLNPGKWVGERRGSSSEQRDLFTADAHSEYQDGQWWPYQMGVGPSAEDKLIKEADSKQYGSPQSFKEFYEAVGRRYNNPTGDAYMDKEYQRLVVAPARATRSAHVAGKPAPSDAVGMGGQLESARDAMQHLDDEVASALPALERIFRDLPAKGLPGSPAWPDQFPADAGLTKGVFRTFNPHSKMQGGEGDPHSWDDVVSSNYDTSIPLTLPGGVLVPKEATSHDWPYSSPDAPLGYVDTHEHNFVQTW